MTKSTIRFRYKSHLGAAFLTERAPKGCQFFLEAVLPQAKQPRCGGMIENVQDNPDGFLAHILSFRKWKTHWQVQNPNVGAAGQGRTHCSCSPLLDKSCFWVILNR